MVLILFASCCIITPKIGLKVQATIGFHRNLPPYYGHSVISLDCVMVLHRINQYYQGITSVLHRINQYSKVLHQYFLGITSVLHWYYINITLVLHQYYT